MEDDADDLENISLRLVMEDDTSESLSPPVLLPLQEVNSDFEENIEDPPDLNMYQLHHGKIYDLRQREDNIDDSYFTI